MHHAAEQAAIGSDAEECRRQNLVEMRVARGVVFEDDIARLPRVGVAEMRLEAALPVGMAERDGTRGEHQLARDEKVVRDRVGGEVGEVPETKGTQRIARREVEDLLSKHQKVSDVAIIGVDDEKFGQRLKAFVVAANGKPSEDELKQYVKSNLAGYKVPREIEFRDELPRTSTGKVLKRELKEDGEGD